MLLVAAGVTSAETERVLTGTYTTAKLDGPGPIQGVFTQIAEEGEVPKWSVVFTVTFQSADYVFRGLAEGGLEEGQLSGEVKNESGSQTFIFRGEHRDGKFHAIHAETTGGLVNETGGMTLEAEPPPKERR